jgi:hypothetical protein
MCNNLLLIMSSLKDIFFHVSFYKIKSITDFVHDFCIKRYFSPSNEGVKVTSLLDPWE